MQVGKREKATPEGLGIASMNQNKSRQCNGCTKKELNGNFKRCSSCKLVFYCSQACQRRHWGEHQKLCRAIQEQSSHYNENLRGLGDSKDTGVFVSHLSPKKHAAIAKLVGQKCHIKCLINDINMDVLWDTRAQVSIIPEQVLINKFPELQVRDVSELLGVGSGLNLTAANGTPIPYSGWIETKFRLNRENSNDVTVPFLVTPERLEQPIIGYNVIELFVQGGNDQLGNLDVIHSIFTSISNVGEKDAEQLISFTAIVMNSFAK